MLQLLATADEAEVRGLAAGGLRNELASQLDGRTYALVRIAALVATDAPPVSYVDAVESARRWRVPKEEIAGCLVAMLPVLGVEAIASAAPKLGLALGIDVGLPLA
jgi:4-carboxymuconolactone decarboxylase